MSATRTRPPEAAPRPEAPAPRSVAQVLDELGASLDEAFAHRRRAALGSRRLRVFAVALLAAAIGLAAVVVARPTTAPRPRAVAAVRGLVGRGQTGPVAWALAVTACPAGRAGYSVSLVTNAGSTSTSCAGAARPAGTLYDQPKNMALAFGSAPAGTARVLVGDSGGGQRAAAIARHLRGVPVSARGAVLFVAPIPFSQTATAITAFGSGSRLLEACSELRCVAP